MGRTWCRATKSSETMITAPRTSASMIFVRSAMQGHTRTGRTSAGFCSRYRFGFRGASREPPVGATSTRQKLDKSHSRAVIITRRLAARTGGSAQAATIRTTLLGSYGRFFLGAFMPVVESVAPDLGDCNHGGVACLGISLPKKETRSTPLGRL